jgi:hypothetical protein
MRPSLVLFKRYTQSQKDVMALYRRGLRAIRSKPEVSMQQRVSDMGRVDLGRRGPATGQHRQSSWSDRLKKPALRGLLRA